MGLLFFSFFIIQTHLHTYIYKLRYKFKVLEERPRGVGEKAKCDRKRDAMVVSLITTPRSDKESKRDVELFYSTRNDSRIWQKVGSIVLTLDSLYLPCYMRDTA